MANKLRFHKLTSVDLVKAGANQEANICIAKSVDADHAETPPTVAPVTSRTVSKSDPNRYDCIIEVFP